MSDIRPLTLLHSNDMHGDFLAEEIDDMIRREEFPQTDHILAWMLWKNKEDHP